MSKNPRNETTIKFGEVIDDTRAVEVVRESAEPSFRWASIVAGDKSKGAKYIAEHPEEYGFHWSEGPVSGSLAKNTDLTLLRENAPKVNVRPDQIELFLATFGPSQLAKAFNGVSPTVTAQRIARDTLIANRNVSNAELREKIVLSLLLNVIVRGPVSIREVETFVAVDGSKHKTADAALAANSAVAAADTEKQAAFLAACVDRGMSMEAAQSLWLTLHA